MWGTPLLPWQQTLLDRLERGLGRQLIPADVACVSWNTAAETLTVQTQPLLGDVRSRNLISNVFRGGPRKT